MKSGFPGGVDPLLASLPGLRNRLRQCPQTCTVTAVIAGVESIAPGGTSDALLEAMASGGPSSNRRETRLPTVPGGGGCMDDAATAVFSVASPALRFEFGRGSPGASSDRLRVCCRNGDLSLLLASIAVCKRVVDLKRDAIKGTPIKNRRRGSGHC